STDNCSYVQDHGAKWQPDSGQSGDGQLHHQRRRHWQWHVERYHHRQADRCFHSIHCEQPMMTRTPQRTATATRRVVRSATLITLAASLAACAVPPREPVQPTTAATLTPPSPSTPDLVRSEEHTSELQSRENLV